jgi:hypothetical protein
MEIFKIRTLRQHILNHHNIMELKEHTADEIKATDAVVVQRVMENL